MVIWKDPDARGTVTSGANRRPNVGLSYAEEAAELRRRPGDWALILEFSAEDRASAYNTVNGIKSGRLAAFRPGGQFDAKTVSELTGAGDRVVNVYAVYRGQA